MFLTLCSHNSRPHSQNFTLWPDGPVALKLHASYTLLTIRDNCPHPSSYSPPMAPWVTLEIRPWCLLTPGSCELDKHPPGCAGEWRGLVTLARQCVVNHIAYNTQYSNTQMSQNPNTPIPQYFNTPIPQYPNTPKHPDGLDVLGGCQDVLG